MGGLCWLQLWIKEYGTLHDRQVMLVTTLNTKIMKHYKIGGICWVQLSIKETGGLQELWGMLVTALSIKDCV